MKNIILSTSFFLAATVIIGSLVVGERIYKNDFVNSIVEVTDLKDRSCKKAVTAARSSCPQGCKAKPLSGPEKVGSPPECRSKLWVATCSTDCKTRKGLVRLQNGRFADSNTLIVLLKSEAGVVIMSQFEILGVELHNGISGLNRYKANLQNPNDNLKTLSGVKERIEKIDEVVSVDYIVK